MAETHPLVAAVARAMCLSLCPTNDDRLDLYDEENNEVITIFRWEAYVPAALAAARVILSAEPSDAHILAVAHAYTGTAESIIRASNATLLREIEGEGK